MNPSKITLYYHHTRMLGMYRSGWCATSDERTEGNTYDDGPVQFALPDGYSFAECKGGTMEVYGPGEQHTAIITVAGHACIVIPDSPTGESIRLKHICSECSSEVAEPRAKNEHIDSEGLCEFCKVKLGYR